jgi:hypothetical protein
LGDPTERERWVDDYGRPWFTYVWHLKRSDEVLIFDCLTNVAGWACRWKQVSKQIEEGARIDAKRTARRTTLSYYGRVKDWTELLALPDEFRPKLFANAVVRFDKALTFDLHPFSGTINVPSLTDTSKLYVFASIGPSSLTTQHIVEVRLIPRRDKSYSFGAQEVLEPVAQSSEAHLQFWKSLQAGSPPYNNVPVADGRTNTIKRVLPASPTQNGGKAYIEYCRSGTEDAKAELQQTCASFQRAVKIAQTGR